MSHPVIKRDAKDNHKNVSKSQDPRGWCTEDLFFDEDGALFIRNKKLAEAIASSMAAWGNRLTISVPKSDLAAVQAAARASSSLDKPGGWMHPTSSEETADSVLDGAYEAQAQARSLTLAPDSTQTDSEPKANMMCPCAPEPTP